MIRQDDVLLNTMSEFPFDKFGCAVMDIQYLSVMHGSNIFTRAHFIDDCENWVKAGVMLPDTSIQNWDKMMQDSGLPYRMVFEHGTHKLDPLRKLEENELQLLFLFNPETGFHHFVVGDHGDNIVYDSLGESVTGKAYKEGIAFIESRRVFRRIS